MAPRADAAPSAQVTPDLEHPMTEGPGSPIGANPSLPLSDPTLAASSGHWDDWTLPNRKLTFIAEGRMPDVSWNDVVARVSTAFAATNLGSPYLNPPGFDPAAPRGPGNVPGYGWAVGEADLQVLHKFRLISSANYLSFVCTVQFWESPAPSGKTQDAPVLIHDWAIRVRAGRVQSSLVTDRSGPYRMFWEVAPTEASLGWIAPAVVSFFR